MLVQTALLQLAGKGEVGQGRDAARRALEGLDLSDAAVAELISAPIYSASSAPGPAPTPSKKAKRRCAGKQPLLWSAMFVFAFLLLLSCPTHTPLKLLVPRNVRDRRGSIEVHGQRQLQIWFPQSCRYESAHIYTRRHLSVRSVRWIPGLMNQVPVI